MKSKLKKKYYFLNIKLAKKNISNNNKDNGTSKKPVGKWNLKVQFCVKQKKFGIHA